MPAPKESTYTAYTNSTNGLVHIMRKGYGTIITLPPKQMGTAIVICHELEYALSIIPENAHPAPF